MSGDKTMTIDDIMFATGVGRAAVTNWRARHKDFPPPVIPGSKRSLRFDKTQMMAWLELHKPVLLHKQKNDVLEGVLAIMLKRVHGEHADRYEAALTALRLYCLYTLDSDGVDVSTWEGLCEHRQLPMELGSVFVGCAGELTIGEKGLLAMFEKLPEAETPAEVCEAILRLLFTGLASSESTPHGVPGAMTGRILAAAVGTTPVTPEYVYGGACALGDGLLGLPASTSVDVFDPSETAVQIAALRLHFHGLTDIEFPLSDGVGEEKTFDVVVTDASGRRVSQVSGFDRLDARWGDCEVSGSHAVHAAYVLDALSRLAPNGYAYVVTPGALLSARGLKKFRTALVADGCVEAVIEFPTQDPGRRSTTRALWILRRGGADSAVVIEATDDTDVLNDLAAWVVAIRDEEPLSVNYTVVTAAVMGDRSTSLRMRHHMQPILAPGEAGSVWGGAATDVEESLAVMRAYVGGPEYIDSSTGRTIGALDVDTRPPFSTARVVSVAELVRRKVLRVVQCHTRPVEQKGQSWTREIVVLPLTGDAVNAVQKNGTVRVPDDYDVAHYGDVLVPIMGQHDALWLPLNDWAVTSSARVLRVTDPTFIDPMFLMWCVNGEWNRATVTSSGVPRRALKELQIPLLPITEQKEFVDYLVGLEDLRETAQRLNEQATSLMTTTMSALRSYANP